MPNAHLTKRLIETTNPEISATGYYVLWDDTVPGLGLRIYTDAKAFVLRYRNNGKQRLFVLGKFPIMSLDEARTAAHKYLKDIAGGADPLHDKREKRDAASIKDLAKRYIEEYAEPKLRAKKDVISHVNNFILPAWKDRKVASINGSDVARMHAKIGKENGPYRANRTVSTIHRMFELAIRWQILPAGAPNPARGIEKFKEQKRHRPLTADELPRLAAAIDTEANPFIRAAIWMLIHTGARLHEILDAKWIDVDKEQKTITIVKTKQGKPHVVPLTTVTIKILEALPREKDNPFIFCGAKKKSHLVNMHKPWVRVLKVAGLPADIRLHDLRHTAGTWLSGGGATLTIVGEALGHSQPSTTHRYARPAQDPVRAALEKYSQELKAAAAGDPVKSAEVVPIKKAGA